MPINFDISIGDIIKSPIVAWSVAFVLLLNIIINIIKNIPVFLKIKALIYLPLASWLKFKKLQKEAIRCDIQGTINYAIGPIIKELPTNSIKPMELEYVNRTRTESFIQDGKIFIRIRPVHDEDKNFMNVVQVYLEMTLVPEAKNFLSTEQIKSITYFTTKRLIEGKKSLINKLHDEYYLPDIEKFSKMKEYFEKIERVDNKGLFFSILIRMLERGASSLRFKRGNLQEEFDKVLEHLVRFIVGLKKNNKKNNNDVWIYVHKNIPFAILLVANPRKAFLVSPESYVKRLKEDLKLADWVFVVFSQAEYKYGKRVAKAIKSSGEVEFVDCSRTWKDYRGKIGGIVNLYVKKDRLKRY